MTITVGGTAITFNDGTTQTTAAGGAPAFGAVGSVAMLSYYNTSTAALPNSTVAGSSLYYPTAVTYQSSPFSFNSESSIGNLPNTYWSVTASGRSVSGPNSAATAPGGSSSVSGTWRCLSGVPRSYVQRDYCNGFSTTVNQIGLFVRVS